jgi:predicted Ser/Thr protein kinase
MPDRIGRYEVSEELGKGAMGVVYKAVDPNIGRPVALKTMRLDISGAESADMLKRFQNEARSAGVLNHPNIVTIYDAGEEDSVFYIAMEYIPGRTLADLLRQVHVVSAEQLVNIGTQICAGLDYAHTKRVIHRDIKPPNIMIAPDGTVKIMDFGIAKAGASLTHTGEVLGTPNYMSPEQVKGKDLDGRTDLFSTGVILYEMATGERPFNGQNVTTIIYKIINETPVPPRELDVTIHPGLSMIITKCLSKDPEDRYQSGSDLATALKSYKIISVPEARGTVAPMVSPSATAIGTRAIPVAPPTQLRTAAPASGLAAATAKAAEVSVPIQRIATKPTQEPTPKTPLKPAATKKINIAVPTWLVVVLAVLVVFGIAVKRRAQHLSPTVTAQPAATPAPAGTADTPTESLATPPRPVPDTATHAAREHATKPDAAVPAEGVGELRITSNPSGALIEIDGVLQDYYITPFNAPPMKSGTHMLRATLAGFPALTRQVNVVAGQKTTVDLQLTGDKAVYNISSTPSGADVIIDGVPSGRSTPTQLALTPGQHRVTLRLEGFFPSETTTDATAGQTINLTPMLRARNSTEFAAPQQPDSPGLGALAGGGRLRDFYQQGIIPPGMGAVQIHTRPRGASIMVDERMIPRATPFKFPLKPGSYVITLQKDGFQPVKRMVQIQEGQQLEIDEILPPQR